MTSYCQCMECCNWRRNVTNYWKCPQNHSRIIWKMLEATRQLHITIDIWWFNYIIYLHHTIPNRLFFFFRTKSLLFFSQLMSAFSVAKYTPSYHAWSTSGNHSSNRVRSPESGVSKSVLRWAACVAHGIWSGKPTSLLTQCPRSRTVRRSSAIQF